jgi:hypothetical protein
MSEDAHQVTDREPCRCFICGLLYIPQDDEDCLCSEECYGEAIMLNSF